MDIACDRSKDVTSRYKKLDGVFTKTRKKEVEDVVTRSKIEDELNRGAFDGE